MLLLRRNKLSSEPLPGLRMQLQGLRQVHFRVHLHHCLRALHRLSSRLSQLLTPSPLSVGLLPHNRRSPKRQTKLPPSLRIAMCAKLGGINGRVASSQKIQYEVSFCASLMVLAFAAVEGCVAGCWVIS